MIYSYPQLPLEDCRAVQLFPDYKDYIYEDVPSLPINKNTILPVKTNGRKNYLFLYLFKRSSYGVLIEIPVKTISNRILFSELLYLFYGLGSNFIDAISSSHRRKKINAIFPFILW